MGQSKKNSNLWWVMLLIPSKQSCHARLSGHLQLELVLGAGVQLRSTKKWMVWCTKQPESINGLLKWMVWCTSDALSKKKWCKNWWCVKKMWRRGFEPWPSCVWGDFEDPVGYLKTTLLPLGRPNKCHRGHIVVHVSLERLLHLSWLRWHSKTYWLVESKVPCVHIL